MILSVRRIQLDLVILFYSGDNSIKPTFDRSLQFYSSWARIQLTRIRVPQSLLFYNKLCGSRMFYQNSESIYLAYSPLDSLNCENLGLSLPSRWFPSLYRNFNYSRNIMRKTIEIAWFFVKFQLTFRMWLWSEHQYVQWPRGRERCPVREEGDKSWRHDHAI